MGLTFSEFARELRFDDLPDAVRGIMKRSLLDTIGVGAVGSRTQIADRVQRFVKQQFAAGDNGPRARLMFDAHRVSPSGAAMAGAFCIDSIDAHDGNSTVKGHAGSALVPSILAVTDDLLEQGRSFTGKDLLTALAVGYEISYRSGLALHATAEDYHTSGAWTAVGIAAACARMLGLDDEALRHAVGIAEYHGPRSQMMRCIDYPTNVRDGVGWGAPSGVSAAYLAAIGFTGAPAITITAGEVARFWQDLGQNWEIRNTHYKLYPVCRWAHPAIDAASQLMQAHGLNSTEVESVHIRTFEYAARLAGHEPENLDDVTYSLAFPVATMIARGQIGVPELAPEILDDQEIRRIIRATHIEATEHYTKISVGKRWADIRLYLKDGRCLESPPCSPKGDPEDPLSDAQISTKFHLFADPVLGVERSGEIEMRVQELDTDSANLERLLELVHAPVATGEQNESGPQVMAAR